MEPRIFGFFRVSLYPAVTTNGPMTAQVNYVGGTPLTTLRPLHPMVESMSFSSAPLT